VSKIEFYKALVTPEMASDLLRHTPFARSINRHRVNQYAADMASGRWLDTAETIRMTADGIVLNGHHRLYAIVRSGVAVWMYFARGVDPSTLVVQDSGMSVRNYDWIDHKNAKVCVSIVTVLLRAFGLDTPPASRGIREAMWSTIGDDHMQFGALLNRHTAPCAMAAALVHRVNQDRAETMYARLSLTADMPTDSPEANWLRCNRNKKRASDENAKLALRLALACARDERMGLMRASVNLADAEKELRLSDVLSHKRDSDRSVSPVVRAARASQAIGSAIEVST
jgi:hypothetical protein